MKFEDVDLVFNSACNQCNLLLKSYARSMSSSYFKHYEHNRHPQKQNEKPFTKACYYH